MYINKVILNKRKANNESNSSNFAEVTQKGKELERQIELQLYK